MYRQCTSSSRAATPLSSCDTCAASAVSGVGGGAATHRSSARGCSGSSVELTCGISGDPSRDLTRTRSCTGSGGKYCA